MVFCFRSFGAYQNKFFGIKSINSALAEFRHSARALFYLQPGRNLRQRRVRLPGLGLMARALFHGFAPFYANAISRITILFSQRVLAPVMLMRTAPVTTGAASGTRTVSPASPSPAAVQGMVYSTPSSAQLWVCSSQNARV